jgi:hypothetical protein
MEARCHPQPSRIAPRSKPRASRVNRRYWEGRCLPQQVRKPFYGKQPDRRASPYSGEAAQATARSDFDAERGQDMADARGRHLACPIHIVEGRRGGGEDRSGPRRVPFHKLGGVWGYGLIRSTELSRMIPGCDAGKLPAWRCYAPQQARIREPVDGGRFQTDNLQTRPHLSGLRLWRC